LPAEDFVGQVFSGPGVQLAPLTPEAAVRAAFLEGFPHADPADRMLIATAMSMGLRLVTRDKRILSYAKGGRLGVLAC
jgi:PIN domain nuclease of toxin-antitoxin system